MFLQLWFQPFFVSGTLTMYLRYLAVTAPLALVHGTPVENHCLRAVLFNLFWLTAPCETEKIWRHPYLDKMTIWGTPSSKRTKKVVNSIFGGSPDTSSRHPSVLRHPRLGTTALERPGTLDRT
jgi:hypothetical protein